MVKNDVKSINLSAEGKNRIEWAAREMPVLLSIRDRFRKEKPLSGRRVGGCLHITSETANLAITLKEGGAEVFFCASNPLSTNDSVAASMVADYGISVFAVRGEDRDLYYKHLNAVLDAGAEVLMDDGADLISTAHGRGEGFCRPLIGGTEETTTGVIRFANMEKEGAMCFPVIAVNEARTKHLFDNRYGTGQSTIDGLLRATNVLLAGKRVVVAGYGWCSRGIAMRARGMGAVVIVTEVDPLRALEAHMDGYLVMPAEKAAAEGEIFITATGNRSVIREEHFRLMKNGAIIGNSGHFNVEIDIPALEKMSRSSREIRAELVEYTLPDGRRINLLAQGRLLNLAAAEGHPSAVMDMSFANQALSAEYLVANRGRIQTALYPVPEELDAMVARLKLEASGIRIDTFTDEQKKYLASWEQGT